MVLEDLAEVTSGTLTSLGYGSPGDLGAGQIKDLRLAKTARKRRLNVAGLVKALNIFAAKR